MSSGPETFWDEMLQGMVLPMGLMSCHVERSSADRSEKTWVRPLNTAQAITKKSGSSSSVVLPCNVT
eukprot:1362484-Rhodomonas_salina.1